MTTEEFITSYLCIDPTSPTGLTWLGHRSKTHSTMRTGKPAGSITQDGRYHLMALGKRLFNHRVVFFLHHGHWPTGEVDHIDGNPANNNPDNLRDVTSSENKHNIKAKGYCWSKQRQKWQASIELNNKQRHLGFFTDEESARAAYLAAKRQLHPTASARCFEVTL